jgi:acetoin utilization deacetylase AcuC-like enzyme
MVIQNFSGTEQTYADAIIVNRTAALNSVKNSSDGNSGAVTVASPGRHHATGRNHRVQMKALGHRNLGL